jgi:hypothetical protein
MKTIQKTFCFLFIFFIATTPVFADTGFDDDVDDVGAVPIAPLDNLLIGVVLISILFMIFRKKLSIKV